MINTLRKVVLGVCFAAAVTALAGTVDTYAASKAEEAREAAIKEYKAEVEKVREAEKAQIKEIRDEAAYRTELEQEYANSVKFSEAYVKAVVDQSRGLDIEAIKEAQKFARENIDYSKWMRDKCKSEFKNRSELEAYLGWKEDMTEEEVEAYWKNVNDLSKGAPEGEANPNMEAYKKAFQRVYPTEEIWW